MQMAEDLVIWWPGSGGGTASEAEEYHIPASRALLEICSRNQPGFHPSCLRWTPPECRP